MQELEKTLLKETEQLVNMHYEDDSVKTIILRNLRDIRKHMSGKDADVAINDSWIPVEERLPEDGQTILCTDGEYVYLVEYDADLDAPFGDMDGIIAWRLLPELYRSANKTEASDWREDMLRKFNRRD